MIIVCHLRDKITSVVSRDNQRIHFDYQGTIAKGLLLLAERFPNEKMVWCHADWVQNLDLKAIESLFHHDKMMFSYSGASNNYFQSTIGYVEESPFIKINKKVSYPSWQMSSLVGVLHASLLLSVKDKIKADSNFDYYLNSLAKLCMPLGLFCYSEPKLLQGLEKVSIPQASMYTLFRFVRQHYKKRWTLLLVLNLIIYERRFPFGAFLYAGFFMNRNKNGINLDAIAVNSSLKVVERATIDVIIPTIGRKMYLYDVLCDLRNQSHLPKNVIIVEQNPLADSVSELDYLQTEDWPFVIKHSFTHQPGACNARNIALKQLESEWVFLADDDIRIPPFFIFSAIERINAMGAKAVSLSCLVEEEIQKYTGVFQWISFGSGCSIVASESLKELQFDLVFEFGYGEDSDFGMQLRNNGFDILYLPEPSIKHLRAPMGGFRTRPHLPWHKDGIQPKPSPTIMFFKINNLSKEQLLGYKTVLFFKYYKHQKIKNPIRYFLYFRKQWRRSVFWANKLKERQ
ncbi:glycosyltransferase family 2 protein [Flavobacterium granuli]|uniref:GT2 family glycosyltransferase n=1 Tax=Flavobacterium granuli TaxID=280093 RepID=A0A1M5QMA6_9FLAO|nr:glycosyltransferase [Flavobacterium granuli]PRZ20068.1 GT2 family glycosyltransferase [Flavobacterium granuli]SHH14880.1 Glycosyltransferase, GT2 family [Flavobacterium granuli]